MKRFILMLAMFSSLGVQAQLQKGTQLIGGNIQGSYSGAKAQNSESWSLGLSPKYAYFLKDKFALGFRLGYGYDQSYTSSTTGYASWPYMTTLSYALTSYTNLRRTNSLSGGLFVQNYFMLNDKFGFLLQSGIDAHRSGSRYQNESSTTSGLYVLNGTTDTISTTASSFSSDYKSNSLDISVGVIPCIVYFPRPNIGLVATFGTFGLNHSMNPDRPRNSGRTSFNAGLMSMSLSFQYHFGKSKE
jgi:hypothetical protein